MAQSVTTPSQDPASSALTSYTQPTFRNGPGDDQRLWSFTQDGLAKVAISKVRVERAQRAAELINADRCSDAYKLAINARDHAMAARVTTVCAARS